MAETKSKKQTSEDTRSPMPDSTTTTTTTTTPTTTPTTTTSSSSSSSSSSWGKDGSVNDYSRFEEVGDPEEEGPLVEALRCKDRGNQAFKNKLYQEAIKHYTEAISDMPAKRDDKKNPEARVLRVSLYSNRAACQLQLGNLDKCVEDATSALKSDKKAAKALFRRAQAYEKRGKVEDACRDLYAVVRNDPSNKSARRAYQKIKKKVHSRSLKAIVDGYNAAEAKAAKEAREKEEKNRREAAKKAAKVSSNPTPTNHKRAKRTPDTLSDVDEAEAQEDEEATLKEVKKKGYCYFNTKMDEKTQALYKNTSPRKIIPAQASSTSTGSTPPLASQPRPLSKTGSNTSGGSGSFSDWNKAGTTWEEQDVSSRVLKELPGFLTGTSSLGGEGTSAKIVSISGCDGTASVACVRAKLRFFFDLSLKAKFSVELADKSVVGGTLVYTSMTALDMDDPDEDFEVVVKFDAGAPADKKKETRLQLKFLQAVVKSRMKEFANSFLATF